MESSKDRYYDITKKYLTLIGQWPYQEPKESLFFFIVILFFDANVLLTQVTLTVIERSLFFKKKKGNN